MNRSELSTKILSDITVYSKYARYLPEHKRRETWEEIVIRNAEMHIKRFPHLEDEIYKAYRFVLDKKVLPSMRSLQFGGKPIEISPNRLFNCAFVACDDPACFSEAMFLLLGGSGVGYSVQKHHVEKLPEITGPKARKRRYLIGDSIEGWADAVKVLIDAYYCNKSDPEFDFRDIRQKGATLVTSGGKAPGPQPLKDCLHNIRKIFDNAKAERGLGTQLTTLEVHDIMCYIADAVLAGGIRRAALIALFSFDDDDMLTCKYGQWWELNPQRARANNSAVALRHKIKEKDFFKFWKKVQASGCGEPGIYFTNDKDYGANPCVEIALRSCQFCNLTTTNVSDVYDQEDLNARIKAAAFIGTLQASYTDFHYLRDKWKHNTEKDALLGVSMTGIASGGVLKLDLEEAAKVAVEENKRAAALLGINVAARITCIKPEGTTSCVLGSSSGAHAWHWSHFIRRFRLGKNEPIYKYLKKVIPDLLEDEFLRPDDQVVLSLPIKAPEGAILRTESAIDLLNRGKLLHTKWVQPGHLDGQNSHNVSMTVSIKDDEWDAVGQWMWQNREYYNGIAVLPYDGGNYTQAPFEDCDESTYEAMLERVKNIDLTKVLEEEDTTSLKENVACSGGACTVTSL
jgi:ribonucleoside-triphosphate reductase (thioredoxin)